jgi:hypothetical protein
MKLLRILQIFLIILCGLPIHVIGKILSEDTYGTMLKNYTNAGLKEEYIMMRKSLTVGAKKFPSGIETDVTWTQEPEYKMKMFKVVVQEIVNRLAQAKTIEELTLLADLFFKMR